MLERVALNATRLRTPGLRLDADGVALGARVLVLLPSLDRLVAFLTLHATERSLSDLPALTVQLCETKLKTREIVIGFGVTTTDGIDRVAGVARLAGGTIFTGTQRIFVQYRDAASPLGYDIGELPRVDSALHLVHATFEQGYDVVRNVDVAGLLVKLELTREPSTADVPGERWIVCEPGLGPALVHYLARSDVAADVGLAEWPPESALSAEPVRRYLVRVPELPRRMRPLLSRTPGLRIHALATRGCAVEVGFAHPVNLRACPVFPEDGLVFLGGRGTPALRVERLPPMGPVSAFAKVMLRQCDAATATRTASVPSLDLELRLAPSATPPRNLRATLVRDLALLRQVAYRLGSATLRDARVAFTDAGAFVLVPQGVDVLPLGDFFEELSPTLFVSAGYTLRPEVSPARAAAAFDAGDAYVFVHHDGRRLAVVPSAFVPLEAALVGSQSWVGLDAESIAVQLSEELPTLRLAPLELRPMRDVTEEIDST
jgi:hypothetical protein